MVRAISFQKTYLTQSLLYAIYSGSLGKAYPEVFPPSKALYAKGQKLTERSLYETVPPSRPCMRLESYFLPNPTGYPRWAIPPALHKKTLIHAGPPNHFKAPHRPSSPIAPHILRSGSFFCNIFQVVHFDLTRWEGRRSGAGTGQQPLIALPTSAYGEYFIGPANSI